MESEKLGEMASVTAGTSPKGDLINSQGLGLPFFQGTKEFGDLFPTAERFTEHPVRVAKKGEILIGVRAPVGEVNFALQDSAIGRGVMAVNAKNQQHVNFLFYFLKNLQGKWDSLGSTGSVFENLSASTLREISVPSGLHKRQIGDVLLNIDLKIQANRSLSKTLEGIAETVFKSWFIDFDPVKAKMAGEKPVGMDEATAALFPDSMEESELGLIPSGWGASQLKEVLSLEKSSVKAGVDTEALPYVPIDQISSQDIFLRRSNPGQEAKTSLVRFKKYDILFGAMRPYFHKVALAPFDGTTRSTTFVLRPVSADYLSFGLFSIFQDDAVAYATNHSQGTTIPYAVWANSFDNYPLVVPPLEIARAFHEIVFPLLELGLSLVKQDLNLVETRDSLLPRLISGELQIPEELLAS